MTYDTGNTPLFHGMVCASILVSIQSGKTMNEQNTPFDQFRNALNGRDNQPIVLGVCITLARRVNVEPWITRCIAIICGVFFTFFTLAVYILLGFLLDETNERTSGFFRGLQIWLTERWQVIKTKWHDDSHQSGHYS